MKVYCCCCARQIVQLVWDRELMAPLPATCMGPGKYACADCSKDLDEYGMFPEERAQAEAIFGSLPTTRRDYLCG